MVCSIPLENVKANLYPARYLNGETGFKKLVCVQCMHKSIFIGKVFQLKVSDGLAHPLLWKLSKNTLVYSQSVYRGMSF